MNKSENNMIKFFPLYLGSTFNQVYVVSMKLEYLYCSNLTIARLLDISLKEYITLLESYGAYKDERYGHIFSLYDKADNFVKYLNDKYLVLLKLQGKI